MLVYMQTQPQIDGQVFPVARYSSEGVAGYFTEADS